MDLAKQFLLSLALFFLVGVSTASAQSERIISYNSDVTVNPDASMVVEETIKVYAGGYSIRRGIFRDFPTRTKDDMGNTKLVSFKLLSVKRDGKSEPHHLSYFNDGLRIYIGHEDVFLFSGEYTYSIKYKTERQLGFFPDHDELYWNVTGNFWEFPIEQASIDIHLPARLSRENLDLKAFTGKYGRTGDDFLVTVTDRGKIHFESTRELGAGEGLTVVVGFPKGNIAPPTAGQIKGWWIEDHLVQIAAVVGVTAVFCYYFLAWLMVGVDPKQGLIKPVGSPPENLSPAALRYIRSLQCDHRTFVAAILSMGAKGWLRVVEETPGTFWIHRNKTGEVPLAPEEETTFKKLFYRRESLEIDKENHAVLSGSRSKLSDSLAKQFKGKLFFLNHGLLILGAFISIIVTIVTLSQITYSNQALNLTAILGMIVSLVIINVVFMVILPRYTKSGRAMRDAIEGYVIGLQNAGAAGLDLTDHEQRERFNSYLPYAVALGVQDNWSRQMEHAFEQSELGPPTNPGWYSPHYSNHRGLRGFTREMSSTFSSSLSSAGVNPSSSSGSSGGFSGGGGGGGGGGGW